MVAKAQILFNCSEEMKEAIGKFANDKDWSIALVVRKAIAEYIQYDLNSEVVEDRRRKYENDAARKKAQSDKQKAERRQVALLLAAFGQEQRRADAQILKDSLDRKGVSTDD